MRFAVFAGLTIGYVVPYTEWKMTVWRSSKQFSICVTQFVVLDSNDYVANSGFVTNFMCGTISKRRLKPAVVVAAVLLGVVAVKPTTAIASCGDYLLVGSRVVGSHAMPVREGRSPERMATHNPLPLPSGNHGSLPCRGPNCKNSPTAPFSPRPATVVSVDNEQLGLLAEQSGKPRPTFSGATSSEQEFLAVGFRPRVERPPRALCRLGLVVEAL